MRPRARAAVLAALLVAAGILAAGCASSGSTDKSGGYRVLEAIVNGHQYEPPGTGGASYAGKGNHYLIFEVREGDKTSNYTLMVTETQYRRYQDGDRVQITLVDNQLRDIRPRS
ncbi:MAG TPA: hypothetical protein VIB08_01690 [Thermoanaerobaculia bacterium]